MVARAAILWNATIPAVDLGRTGLTLESNDAGDYGDEVEGKR